MIFENIETPKQKLIKTAWGVVQTGRVGDAHKITQPTLSNKDFIKQFRDDCTALLKAFTIVEKELIEIQRDNRTRDHPSVSDNPQSKYLMAYL